MAGWTTILDTIGDAPLLKRDRIAGFPVYAKAESLNPGGIVKDRIARSDTSASR